MTEYILNDEELSKDFNEGQIERYMKENDFSRLESLLYLWGFNHFHTNSDEVSKDLGRPMYRKLAKCLSRILIEKD